MYIQILDLPKAVQTVLDQVGYRRKDIQLDFKEETSLSVAGGAGLKGFSAIININTGETKILSGSWGGANMFNQNNPVDMDTKSYKLPTDCAIVTGVTGGQGGTYAQVVISVDNAPNFLTTGKSQVTDREAKILYCFKGLKSGQYRTDALTRLKVSSDELDELVKKGLLKKDKRGISITTEGKNNAANNYYLP